MVAARERVGQLELFSVAARSFIEAELDGHVLEELHAMSAARPGGCSSWFYPSEIADRLGLEVPAGVQAIRGALLRLLYRRAVRRREGPQAEQWTTDPAKSDLCVPYRGMGL